MNIDDTAPVACTLSRSEFRSRASWLRQVTAEALVSHTLESATARLKYKTCAALDVERLVREESKCCGFLRFIMVPASDGIELIISAPPETAGDLRTLLGHLLPYEDATP